MKAYPSAAVNVLNLIIVKVTRNNRSWVVGFDWTGMWAECSVTLPMTFLWLVYKLSLLRHSCGLQEDFKCLLEWRYSMSNEKEGHSQCVCTKWMFLEVWDQLELLMSYVWGELLRASPITHTRTHTQVSSNTLRWADIKEQKSLES